MLTDTLCFSNCFSLSLDCSSSSNNFLYNLGSMVFDTVEEVEKITGRRMEGTY